MAVIPLPDKVHFEVVDKLQLLRSGVNLKSRYTGKRQSINFPFALWVFEGKLIPVEGNDAGQWRSFLTKLEGLKNTFRLPVPGAAMPLSGYTGAMTLKTAVTARLSSLTINGATPNTLVLRDGDYFNIGDELKIATDDVTTDALGEAVIPFQPPVRNGYPIGQVISQLDPFIYLHAAENDSASWGLSRPVKHGIKLTCVESV